jgi:hypothetical protein
MQRVRTLMEKCVVPPSPAPRCRGFRADHSLPKGRHGIRGSGGPARALPVPVAALAPSSPHLSRNLQHRRGTAVGDGAAWRDRQARAQHCPVRVEEVDVESEPHAEGVDRGAVWDQQARPGFVAIEVREAKEAGAEAVGDRHLAVVDEAVRESVEARSSHRPPKVWTAPISPPDEIRLFRLDFDAKIPSHCNPAFRGVPSKARN